MEEENDEIVKAIVNLGLILGMNVVAEGVETTEQVAHLRDLNCHCGQGYWFSRPINSDAMTEFLLKLN
jgi:EAL domain-containing protein (putative c-di-GMP-specific phosphodiesterase class I)